PYRKEQKLDPFKQKASKNRNLPQGEYLPTKTTLTIIIYCLNILTHITAKLYYNTQMIDL
ncbi:hypothetical protein, partial [Escherichia coli]|uniref:hypothetical protein n=1 Tax=Escherichia coli TaxID=562 RepID=UPI000B3F4B85